MYIGEILGKKVKFSTEDYKSLKKKWHPDKVKSNDRESVIIGRCTLCNKFLSAPTCPMCPLSSFCENDVIGCHVIFHKLFPRADFEMGTFSTDFYHTRRTTQKYMQKIQDILNTFKKV